MRSCCSKEKSQQCRSDFGFIAYHYFLTPFANSVCFFSILRCIREIPSFSSQIRQFEHSGIRSSYLISFHSHNFFEGMYHHRSLQHNLQISDTKHRGVYPVKERRQAQSNDNGPDPSSCGCFCLLYCCLLPDCARHNAISVVVTTHAALEVRGDHSAKAILGVDHAFNCICSIISPSHPQFAGLTKHRGYRRLQLALYRRHDTFQSLFPVKIIHDTPPSVFILSVHQIVPCTAFRLTLPEYLWQNPSYPPLHLIIKAIIPPPENS